MWLGMVAAMGVADLLRYGEYCNIGAVREPEDLL